MSLWAVLILVFETSTFHACKGIKHHVSMSFTETLSFWLAFARILIERDDDVSVQDSRTAAVLGAGEPRREGGTKGRKEKQKSPRATPHCFASPFVPLLGFSWASTTSSMVCKYL